MLTKLERTQSVQLSWTDIHPICIEFIGFVSLRSWVKWFTDSQGALRIIQVGSIHFKLNNLASGIFSFCSNNEMYKEVKLQYLGDVLDPDD